MDKWIDKCNFQSIFELDVMHPALAKRRWSDIEDLLEVLVICTFGCI